MVLKELGVRGTDTTFHHSTKRDRVVFVDDVPPGLVCPACRDAFVCPMIAPCGHSVCKACSEKVNRATGRCFTCDAPANPVDLDDDGVSAVELGDVRALCRHGVGVREGEAGPEVYVRHDEFNVTACSAGVRLRDLETHEAACQFRPLRCDLRDVVHRDEDGAVASKAVASKAAIFQPVLTSSAGIFELVLVEREVDAPTKAQSRAWPSPAAPTKAQSR